MKEYLRFMLETDEKVALEEIAKRNRLSMAAILRRLVRAEAQRYGIELVALESELEMEVESGGQLA